jgi:two-component system, cell cycle sensor histidine kinase and response regulator CckA
MPSAKKSRPRQKRKPLAPSQSEKAAASQDLGYEEIFRQMADNIQEIFWMLNAATYEVIYVSPAFEKICGFPCQKLYDAPTSYREIIHPDDRAHVLGRLEELALTGTFDEEFRIVRPDSAVRWVHTHGFLARDSEGRIARLVGTVQDITERKAAECSLRESEDRYRDAVEHSHDLVCTHDLQGRLLSINQRPANILGYTRDEILNTPMKNFIPQEMRKEFDEYLARVQREGFARGLLCVLTKTGERRIWEYHNTLRTEGVSTPIVRGIAHDVTEQKRTERALRNSEEKFSRAFLSSPIDIAITTLDDGRFIDVNETFERQTGYSRSEVLGRTSLSLALWADPGERATIVDDLKNGRKVSNRETRFRDKSNAIRTKLYSAETIEIDGNPCLLAVCEDITTFKEAQEGRRQSEEKFSKAFRCSPNIIAIVARSDGRFIEVNESFEKQTGYSRDEVLGCKGGELGILTNPSQREELIREIKESGRVVNKQAEVRCKSGDTIQVLFSIEQIELNNEKCILAVAQEVTSRIRVEEALRESEEKFQLMAENIQEIFWIIEPKTLKLIYASPAYEKIWERPHEEIKRDPTAYLKSIHPDDVPRILEKLVRLETAGHLEDEYRIVCPGGRIKWIVSQAFTAKDSHGQLTFVGTTEDVTARHDSEEALRQAQKMDAIALLAGGISHDFNTLLTGMLGYAELLLMSSDLTDSNRRKVESVVAAAVQARAITQQLLTLGRKQHLKPTVVNLNALIVDLADFLRRMAGQGTEIVTDLHWDTGGVNTDATQLTQVIMNLVANARDAMSKGGKLTIKTSALDVTELDPQLPGIEPRPYTVLAISDTGCGMNENTQARIFEPFFTTKPEGKGTGLGLAMVHGIIEQTGGHIRVSSRLGEGTTFKIFLPSTQEPLERNKVRGDQPKAIAGCETIIVVDDHDVARKLTLDFLSAHGYEVLVAKNGREAMQIAKKRSAPIQLLLTDVVMPKMSGPDLAKRMTAVHPETKVLYMTAYADVMDVANLEIMDRSEVLNKPYMHHELMGKVRQLLGRVIAH